jgi:hypothetical protein
MICCGLAACGDVSSANAPGEALYTVPGQLAAGAFAVPEGEYRSVLNWLSVGGGAFIECLEKSSPTQCGLATAEFDATLIVETARLIPAFPSRFTLEVTALPDRARVLTYKDSVLAFGSVSIYDDRNRNGALDLSDEVGLEQADQLVATSAQAGGPSIIVYREGPLHPGWKVLRAFGCADPPVGFSMVVEPTSFRCTVEPIADLTVSIIAEQASLQSLCAQRGGQLARRFGEVPRWEFALNPQAVVTCDPSGESLTYYIDRGNLCDSIFETTLALKGCPSGATEGEGCWDRSDNPPDWWPCGPM